MEAGLLNDFEPMIEISELISSQETPKYGEAACKKT